jgi:hypothetical protein
MRAAFQWILIAARLWPVVAIGAVHTPISEKSPTPKRAQDDCRYHFSMKSEQFSRDLADRVRPLASK